jgi:hypothetical protein
MLCVIFGYEVWVFPNLNADVSIIDSFKPFIHGKKSDTSKLDILIRLAAIGIFLSTIMSLYLFPNILQGKAIINLEKM